MKTTLNFNTPIYFSNRSNKMEIEKRKNKNRYKLFVSRGNNPQHRIFWDNDSEIETMFGMNSGFFDEGVFDTHQEAENAFSEIYDNRQF